MSITTTELARLCNVSRGTVDRALNGRGRINPKTRELILKTAKEQNYVPHPLASSLATGKTRTVGLIVFDLNSRHFAQMVTAAQQHFSALGIFCYICITEKNQAQESSLVRDLISRKVDGIILIPINDGKAFCDMLLDWGRPVVTVHNRLDGRFSFVGGNGDAAVYAGMEHFYQKGYRQVCFVCPAYRRLGQENLFAQSNRVDGFRRFLGDHPDMRGELIAEPSYREVLVRKIRENRGGRLGVFCASDHYALRVYQATREKGLSAPDDFGLMGFDGVDTLNYLDKRITTLFYPAEKIGELSADCLYSMMHDKAPAREVTLDCPIIEGQTL